MASNNDSTGYTTLSQPIKYLPPVVVFFSLLDHTSYDWATKYQVVEHVRRAVPKGVDVHRYHVSTVEPPAFDIGATLTHVWAAAQDLHVDDKMIIALFDAILKDRAVSDLEGIRNVFAKAVNVSGLQFDRAYGKISVRKEAVWMDEVTGQVKPETVPVVVVHGKYLVDGAKLKEMDGFEGEEFGNRVAELVKDLLKRE